MKTWTASLGGSRWLVLAAVVALAQGCAVGQKVSYGDASPELRAGGGAIAVGVQDRRPYVLSGEKTPDFVGVSRGGFYNPFDVNTASGKPLADDAAGAIARSLGARGARVTTVPIAPKDTEAQALAALERAGQPRSLYVTIFEWRSDSYTGTGFDFDLQAVGYGPGGRKLGENRVQGGEHMGGSMGIHSASEELPKELAKKIELLLNDPRLDGALR